jgi:RNA recognition motif-containing protein
MRDGDGVSKGFGFVCFADGKAAEKATQFVMRSETTDPNDKDSGLDDLKKVNGVRVTDLYVREAKKKS